MKTLLLFACILLTHQLFSQNKFNFGVEYAPAFTNVTHQEWLNPYETGLWPVHNFFLRAGYGLSSKFVLTSGLGYITARQFEYNEFDSQSYIESIATHRFYHYIVVPLGFRYAFGSFFINPDISVGFNVGNPVKDQVTYSYSLVVSGKFEDKYSDINDFTYPVSLAFGNEIKMKACSVQLGIRGYYSLSGISPKLGFYNQHYYGFGVFAGVSF